MCKLPLSLSLSLSLFLWLSLHLSLSLLFNMLGTAGTFFGNVICTFFSPTDPMATVVFLRDALIGASWLFQGSLSHNYRSQYPNCFYAINQYLSPHYTTKIADPVFLPALPNVFTLSICHLLGLQLSEMPWRQLIPTPQATGKEP